MNLGLVGFSGSDSLESNMKDVFESLGHEVEYVEFLPYRKLIKRVRLTRISKLAFKSKILQKYNERRLARIVIRKEFDCVIVFTYAANYLSPFAVEMFRAPGRKVFAWFVDGSVNFLPGQFVLAPYDRVFIADYGLYKFLREYSKATLVYMPEGHHPTRHVLETLPPVGKKIAVVGTLYSTRVVQIMKLIDAGYDFSLYGGASQEISMIMGISHAEFYPRIYYEDKAKIFAESLCVLNFPHASAWNSINCRIFEVLAAGGILVTPKSEAISNFLENGKHAFLYENFGELQEILETVKRGEFDRPRMQTEGKLLALENSLLVRAELILDICES